MLQITILVVSFSILLFSCWVLDNLDLYTTCPLPLTPTIPQQHSWFSQRTRAFSFAASYHLWVEDLGHPFLMTVEKVKIHRGWALKGLTYISTVFNLVTLEALLLIYWFLAVFLVKNQWDLVDKDINIMRNSLIS